MTQNLNDSKTKSAFFLFVFVIVFFSKEACYTLGIKIKPNLAISGISISSHLIVIRGDLSLRIKLLSSGKNFEGSKRQSNQMHDCQEHMMAGCVGIKGEVSDYYGNREVKGKCINLHIQMEC